MSQNTSRFLPFITGAMDREKKAKARQWEIAHDFSDLNLTPDNFHAFYTRFVNLRFPIKVEHVLELRHLINHTADKYKEPPSTPDYRQFRESLQTALDSFSIENRRHCERMLKVLSMLRDIHYTHSIISRNAERRLREAMARNRDVHAKSSRYGLFFIFAGVSFIVTWLAMENPHLIIKLLPAVYGHLALRYFHKQPGLERELEQLTIELNDVLRRRVNFLNWKTLIHKLALVLGYKRVPGVEVFHLDDEHADRSVYH